MKINKQFTWKVRTLLGSRRLQDQVKTLDTFDCDMVVSVVNLVQHLNSDRPDIVDIMCQK